MAPKSPFEEIKLTIRCSVCDKVIGYTDLIDLWAQRNFCNSKECRRKKMLNRMED